MDRRAHSSYQVFRKAPPHVLRRAFVFFAVGLMLGISEARACDGPWRYLGHPPQEIVCAIIDPQDSSQVLAGTWCGPSDPAGGGVWSTGIADTAWRYSGLRGRRVFKLSHYPYCRPNVFASTDAGLYMRIADTVWTPLGGGGGLSDQWDFTISPFDTSLWLVLLNNWGLGFMMISHESGWQWSFFGPECSIYPLLWSHALPNVFYFFGGGLNQGNTADSTFQPIRVFSNDIPRIIAGHPNQPWIYVCGLEQLGRYDEITRDTLSVSLPAEVTDVRNVVYAETGLLVNTPQGFYRVSDDLSIWLPDTVNAIAGTLLFTSPRRCLAVNGEGVYISGVTSALAPLRPLPSSLGLLCYPNPFNLSTTISFSLTHAEGVSLGVYDVTGRLARTLCEERVEAGEHEITFDGAGMASGVYFVRLEMAGRSQVQKVMLLK